MPRPPLTLQPDDEGRWAELRTCAANADREARASGLDAARPVLDRIAWLSGFPEPAPDPVMIALIDEARAARCSWREIAAAVGEATDRAGQNRVQARHHWRRTNLV